VSGRPPISLIAAELHLGRGPAARLAMTGVADSLADLRSLARRPVLAAEPATLVVSLGPLRELTPEEATHEGRWRRYVGWARHLTPDDTARSAAAWWRASRIPETLIAVTTGGFIVGAWHVTGIADVDEGRYRFHLGPTRPDLMEHRVKVRPGPVARWLEEPKKQSR
jgi:hypothetical protein